MTAKQAALAQKHGSPGEFAQAVWRACDSLMVTFDEAKAAIEKYNLEWDAAGTEEVSK